jgi:glycerate 2-kinase
MRFPQVAAAFLTLAAALPAWCHTFNAASATNPRQTAPAPHSETTMKIVIAPDSFKESLTSMEVATELETGLRRVWPDVVCIKIPMADGGEGTVQSLVDATGGDFVECDVKGPMGDVVRAQYGLLGGGKTAVIEMAAASGLPLVERGKRNPLLASSYGTGELIADALARGCKDFIIGLGGSATNDGGAGMAQALGVKFLDAQGKEIKGAMGGGQLWSVASIDMSGVNPLLKTATINVACDVTNPLTGPKGASHVYGPQKGATPEMVEQLDRNLGHFATIVRRDLKIEIDQVPGAGAAGGMGGAVIAFCNATLKRGIELVVAATKLEDHMAAADLAITGEGRVDFQTAFGKTPSGVANAAKKFNVPVIAIGGGLSDDARGVFEHGIHGLEAATANPMDLDSAIRKSREYLQNAGERVARMIAIGQRLGKPGVVEAKPETEASRNFDSTARVLRVKQQNQRPVRLVPTPKRPR